MMSLHPLCPADRATIPSVYTAMHQCPLEKACAASIAKDIMGNLKAFQINKKHIDIPEAAEAYAIYKALQMAVEKGWTNVRCFSDAKNVIHSLVKNNNPGVAHWSAQVFILSIINLATSFDNVSFFWILGEVIGWLTMFVNGGKSFRTVESFHPRPCLIILLLPWS